MPFSQPTDNDPEAVRRTYQHACGYNMKEKTTACTWGKDFPYLLLPLTATYCEPIFHVVAVRRKRRRISPSTVSHRVHELYSL